MTKKYKEMIINMLVEQIQQEENLSHMKCWDLKRILRTLDFDQLFKDLKDHIQLNWGVDYVNGGTYIKHHTTYVWVGREINEHYTPDTEYSPRLMTITQIAKQEFYQYLKTLALYLFRK